MRVCNVGSFLFLLLGPKNYQMCPQGVKRIGWIAITVVPNNELRALNIYYKYTDTFNSTSERLTPELKDKEKVTSRLNRKDASMLDY